MITSLLKFEESLPRPPVSINKAEDVESPPYCLSRVNPEKSATSAALDPVNKLNRLDLPTLGLPTIATIEDMT